LIRDNGPTIPGSEVARLFEPLQRLDAARSSHPDGHGLGPSIVQAIANAHRAAITTWARPHRGLAIDVHSQALPVTDTDHEEMRSHTSKRHDQLIVATR
jgi:signal transduction histidine kinase